MTKEAYAVIRDGIVVNVIRGMKSLTNAICFPAYGLPLQYGDRFVDGKFYRGVDEIFTNEMRLMRELSAAEGDLESAAIALIDLEIENAMLKLELE